MATFGIALLKGIVDLLNIYSFAIILSALISWLFLPPTNPVVRFLKYITEPVLGPCRQLLFKILPFSWRRIDFSPILAYLLIQLVIQVLVRVFRL